MPGLFTAEQVAQIAQIVAIATRQQSQPPPPPREVIEEPGRSIERVQKLSAKPYDGSGDPEAAWLWLDRVNKVYGVMGYTDEQRVLFSSFLMEDMAKDWWDAVERRYLDGIVLKIKPTSPHACACFSPYLDFCFPFLTFLN